MTFEASAKEWLEAVAERDKAYYCARWNVPYGGKIFAMRQHMEITSRHTIFGVKSEYGKAGTAAEYCFFVLCRDLTNEILEGYIQMLPQLADNVTDCRNPNHDYTLISLVFVTEGLQDAALKRKIRKFQLTHEFRKEDRQYGWNSCRICAFDLSGGTFTVSAHGGTLRDRLASKANKGK